MAKHGGLYKKTDGETKLLHRTKGQSVPTHVPAKDVPTAVTSTPVASSAPDKATDKAQTGKTK